MIVIEENITVRLISEWKVDSLLLVGRTFFKIQHTVEVKYNLKWTWKSNLHNKHFSWYFNEEG